MTTKTQPQIRFHIITLFEEAMRPYLDASMMWKAQDKGIAEFDFVNLREFGLGPHKSVDDTPYGGGDGMLLRVEPVFAAIESVKARDPETQVVLPTPAGQLWTQALAREFAGVAPREGLTTDLAGEHVEAAAVRPLGRVSGAKQKRRSPVKTGRPDAVAGQACGQAQKLSGRTDAFASQVSGKPQDSPDAVAGQACGQAQHSSYTILCPHYEGYDQRILTLVDHQISLGHYVLTGGELPALIIIDSIVRLLPGVLGGAQSAEIESFSDGNNLEYPQYTKPASFRGLDVPEVLLSGNHGAIAQWRQDHSGQAQ